MYQLVCIAQSRLRIRMQRRYIDDENKQNYHTTDIIWMFTIARAVVVVAVRQLQFSRNHKPRLNFNDWSGYVCVRTKKSCPSIE